MAGKTKHPLLIDCVNMPCRHENVPDEIEPQFVFLIQVLSFAAPSPLASRTVPSGDFNYHGLKNLCKGGIIGF